MAAWFQGRENMQVHNRGELLNHGSQVTGKQGVTDKNIPFQFLLPLTSHFLLQHDPTS